jgi:inner membrane protein
VASLGHLAVGLAAARFVTPKGASRRKFWAHGVVLMGLSMWPDFDVIGFPLGIRYADPLGHRGAAHSFVFAIFTGIVVGLLARWMKAPAIKAAIVATLVVASHPVLDAFTDGGLGVALFWPFSNERIFWPWQPIPVAPIGLGFFSRRGLECAITELLMFLPLWIYALRPRRANP